METTLAKINPKEFGLEETQVMTIEQAFQPKIIERDGYIAIYDQLLTKEISKQVCSEAGELRRKLVKVRTGIADIHKTQKAFFLAAGRFVDAWKNKETAPIEQMEENLSGIEKHYEKLEAERIAKLEAERKLKLLEFTNILPIGLGQMDESVYRNYLMGCKVAYQAKIKAEQESEAERLRLIEIEKENARLKAIEDEKIRKENERLRAEAERKEKELEVERKRQAEILAKQKAEVEKRQREIEEKARKEREVIEEKNRIEREKSEAERKRLEAEIKAKEEAELKARIELERIERERIATEKIAQEEARKAEEKEAKAPDKQKLSKMIDSIFIQIPELKKEEARACASVINAKFEAFKIWARQQIGNI